MKIGDGFDSLTRVGENDNFKVNYLRLLLSFNTISA